MDHIDILQRRAANLLQTYGVEIVKSTRVGLVPKKVQVTRKDGSTYYAIRFVSSDTGKANRVVHPKWKHEDDISGDSEEAKISTVVNSDMSANDKVRHLASLGIYDKKTLADLSEHKYPADISSLLKKEGNINSKEFDNPNDILPEVKDPSNPNDLEKEDTQRQAISDIQSKLGDSAAFKAQELLREQLMKKYNVTVKDKWNSYESRLNRLIVDGFPKAVMAYGTGGVGKTYTFEKLSEHHKLIEYDPEMDMSKGSDEYDFVKIGGKIGSREMQRAMYEHRNKLIVFDDCDSMWNDDGLINVLKNTLDTSGSGKCQWAQRLPETSKGAGDDVPSSFRFEGRMLFITNLSKKQLNETGAAPIAESRASSIDLTMNMEQTLERLEEILPYTSIKDYKGNKLQLTEEDKKAGIAALKEIAEYARVEQLNTRTLGKIFGEARSQRLSGESHDVRKLAIFALQEFGLV